MCGFQAGFRSFSKCKTYNTNTIIYTSMSTALHRDHEQLRGMNFSPKAAGFLFVMWSGRLGIWCCWSNPHIDTFRINENSDWSSSICLYFKYLKSSASTRPIKHTHYNRLWNCEARDFFFLLAKLVSWMTFFTHEATNIFHFREEILPKSFYYLILRMIYNFFFHFKIKSPKKFFGFVLFFLPW